MAIQFYPDDVVVAIDEPAKIGEVLVVHEDVDQAERTFPWQKGTPFPTRHRPSVSIKEFDQFTRTMRPPKGTILVHWVFLDQCELISATCLSIRDRSLFEGDIVKCNAGDAMSGVVLNTKTICSLQPVQTHEIAPDRKLHGLKNVHDQHLSKHVKLQNSPQLIQDVPLSELDLVRDFDCNDIVVYGDWIGHVGGLVQGYTLLLSNNTVVEVSELDPAALEDGYWRYEVMVGDLLQTKKGILRKGRWIYGAYDPSIPPIGVLASSRIIEAHVTWLQPMEGSLVPVPDTVLDRVAIESEKFHIYRRSQRPTGDIVDETVTVTEVDVDIATRVKFKDPSAACQKYSGKLARLPRTATSGYDLNVFDVVDIRKEVRVQWQDLSITEHDSIDLVPDRNMDDESAAWPGEIAHSHDMVAVPNLSHVETPTKVGVIQSVKANDRMATIRWCPNASVHFAVNKSGIINLTTPNVLLQSVIGVSDGPCEEVSLYDVKTPGDLNVKRGDVVMLNQLTVSRLSHINGVNWLGEIVQERLDGTLLIRLGAATPIQDLVFKREEFTIAIRSDDPAYGHDGIDSDDDVITIGDSDSMDTDDFSTDDDEDSDDVDGNSVISLTMREVTYEDENGQALNESDVEDADWESDSEMTDADAPPVRVNNKGTQTEPSQTASHAVEAATAATASTAMSENATESATPAKYKLIEGTAPPDHAFAAEQSPTSSNMKRIQKEHKILQMPGAIPDGVFVSSWESRLDLLRVLFIGPHETPYAHVPFVIDFWLSPEFPAAPPKAFFHSWPGEASLGGSGCVNPNLYENGTICLSLLGTWSGKHQENWNAERSTVLQIVVSVLGLVLVREPYFNEAGYEELAGTEEARRPSILYSERTCLRALNFTISAVAAVQQNKDLRGLDSNMKETVRWLYLAPDGPKLLSRVHGQVRATIARSEEANKEPDGMNVLSQGACVQLCRLAERLSSLLEA